MPADPTSSPVDRSLGHRAPLLWLVLPFLGGLATGRMGVALPVSIGLAAAFAAAVAALAASRSALCWAPAVISCLMFAGNSAFSISTHVPDDWDGMPEREVRLSLRLDRVYPGSEITRKATGMATIESAKGRLRELEGERIYFSLGLRRREVPPISSSVVSAAGLLARVPPAPSPNSFDGYLSGLGANYHIARGRILAVGNGPSPYRRFCDRIAQRMNGILGSGMEGRPAMAAVYRAMMLGRRRGLSGDQEQLFLRGGSMHLFAINGLHIGVVAVSVNALLGLMRFPRPFAAVIVLAVLWLDVDTTGASPSAVRAFLMVSVVETAWALRLPGNPLAALSASALLVALVQPMDFFSASFQMSYAVVAGILTLGIPLGARLRERVMRPCDLSPRESWGLPLRARAAFARHVMPALGIGTAAALVGATTGVEFFGLLSAIGIAVNLLLAPLASLVIVAGFSSIVAGFAGIPAAARLFNSAAAVLLASIDAILRRATGLPGAWIPAHFRAEWIAPAALSVLVAACLFGYATGWRRERGGFWPPIAIVAAALALGVRYG